MTIKIENFGEASVEVYRNRVLMDVALNQIEDMADAVEKYNDNPDHEAEVIILANALSNAAGIRELAYQVLENLDEISKQLEHLDEIAVHGKGGKRA